MPKKYALCVGINNYPGQDIDLSGCVNDATDWAGILTDAGYDAVMLLDTGATRHQILAELIRLGARSQRGDRVVFTYSGHGSWVPDTDGDEADGRDEVLCNHDFQTAGAITDDDLAAALAPSKAGTLIISDSCHSGTVSRLATVTGVVTAVRGKPRFVPPYKWYGISEERAVAMERTASVAPRNVTSLISGCDDTEYSYDAWFGSRSNGAFSRTAIDAYRTGTTLNAWFKRIRLTLPSGPYPQTPQLTAASPYRKYSRAL